MFYLFIYLIGSKIKLSFYEIYKKRVNSRVGTLAINREILG